MRNVRARLDARDVLPFLTYGTAESDQPTPTYFRIPNPRRLFPFDPPVRVFLYARCFLGELNKVRRSEEREHGKPVVELFSAVS